MKKAKTLFIQEKIYSKWKTRDKIYETSFGFISVKDKIYFILVKERKAFLKALNKSHDSFGFVLTANLIFLYSIQIASSIKSSLKIPLTTFGEFLKTQHTKVMCTSTSFHLLKHDSKILLHLFFIISYTFLSFSTWWKHCISSE